MNYLENPETRFLNCSFRKYFPEKAFIWIQSKIFYFDHAEVKVQLRRQNSFLKCIYCKKKNNKIKISYFILVLVTLAMACLLVPIGLF